MRLPVVLELERNRHVFELTQPDDHLLEVVAALARDPHGIALDLWLDLRKLFADQLADLLRELVIEPAAERDRLANLVAARGLDLAPVEDLQRQVPADRLRLDQILDRGRAMLVVGDQDDLILALAEIDGHPLEVEALARFAANLIERVAKLLLVEVA